MELEGYCVRCKTKRIIADPSPQWNTSGTAYTRGTCPVCGTAMTRFGMTSAHDSVSKPPRSETGSRKEKKKARKPKSEKKARRSGGLVIVESPTKAKTIGRYLGPGYRVMSSVGHVRDLLKSRLSVDIDHDYQPEYRVPNDKRKVVKNLKAAGEKAKEIYLATDSDREGEAIAWHVQEAAGFDPSRTQRVVFQEITKSAIVEAFSHPREIDMQRVDAQQARRILDRLVGYKLSPLLWRKVRGRLSAGRVQSVAVRLIVERQREIDDFVPEEYWTIHAQLSRIQDRMTNPRPSFLAKLHKVEGKKPDLNSEADVKPHVEALEGAAWNVEEVQKGKRKRNPAPPFTTSTLQQEASRKINFGTRKTMRIAQQLYEGVEIGEAGLEGLITYMRTDSLRVAREAQERARKHIIDKLGKEFVPARIPFFKTKSETAQEAHEAIRPTNVDLTPDSIKKYLSRDQFRLYRLIWQRFVASQMASAVYDTITIDIKAGDAKVEPVNRPYHFKASGSTLRFPGFLAIYEETKPDDKPENGDSTIPVDLEEGEELDNLQLIAEQHFTQPPPKYSEASLVKALEDNGIGRPSTYASIINTILSRGYVAIEDKRLVPTDIGYVVNDLLVEHFPDVMSVGFTANLESELDDIANGGSWIPVVDSFYKKFSERLEAADESIEKVEIQSEPAYVGRDCPQSGHALVYREGRYGRFIGCSDFPNCRYTEQILAKIGVACPKDGGDVVEKRTKKGRTFFACSNYPDCDWRSWKRPLPEPCPNCTGLLVQINNTHAECTQCGERFDLVREPEADGQISRFRLSEPTK